MGITDFLKVKQYKSENDDMRALLNTQEGQEGMDLSQKLRELRLQYEQKSAELDDVNKKCEKAKFNLASLNFDIELRKKDIVDLDGKLEMQSFGVYKPTYEFADSTLYKDLLSQIREKEKLCIRENRAVTGNMGWTVNGNAVKGKKMVKDMQKLLLRAFNSDADEMISKCKYNNFEQCEKKIKQSADATKKLGEIMQVGITEEYYKMKIEELKLALDYRLKKEAEKEEMRELRSQEREAAKLAKEIEEARKKAEKEKKHYENAVRQLQEQLANALEEEKENILEKLSELQVNLDEIEKQMKDIDYREANQRAGYVYIISNIGAFGPDVFKIGMTRRLEPLDRIDELSDASVPFRFDVHAMIFSTDAVTLETKLHEAFEKKKINLVNARKEFFKVTLDEIKQEVKKNFDKTVEFVEVPEAIQYRESELIRQPKTEIEM